MFTTNNNYANNVKLHLNNMYFVHDALFMLNNFA